MEDNSNKRFWEKVAKVYAPFQEKGNKDLYEILCQKIEPLFRKEQRVLELACGTGQLTSFLADNTNSWIATDFSEKNGSSSEKAFK